MKTSVASRFVITLCVALAPAFLSGQTGGTSTPPTYELTAKWDTRGSQVLDVPFKNDSGRPLNIMGVQATRGLFIGDFPAVVPPGKEDRISFVYQAADNTDGEVDLIRVLTDHGIREILVKVVREAAVKFDTRELNWTVGDAAEAKSATITVTAGTVTPQKVRVTGNHQAVLETAGADTWRVKITPASTAKSGKFAVFVDFDKTLPGTAPVILGVIQPKE